MASYKSGNDKPLSSAGRLEALPGIRVGDRTRTGDNQIHGLDMIINKSESNKTLRQGDALLAAPLAVDPDLARVIEAWPAIPVPIKAAVLTIVGACKKA